MSLFTYTAVDNDGAKREGTIDAVNIDLAIGALQRRGLVLSRIDPVEENQGKGFNRRIALFERVTNADVVMLSRQVTSLFEAQVSAFTRLESVIAMPGAKPSARAASLVLDLAGKARERKSHDQT